VLSDSSLRTATTSAATRRALSRGHVTSASGLGWSTVSNTPFRRHKHGRSLSSWHRDSVVRSAVSSLCSYNCKNGNRVHRSGLATFSTVAADVAGTRWRGPHADSRTLLSAVGNSSSGDVLVQISSHRLKNRAWSCGLGWLMTAIVPMAQSVVTKEPFKYGL